MTPGGTWVLGKTQSEISPNTVTFVQAKATTTPAATWTQNAQVANKIGRTESVPALAAGPGNYIVAVMQVADTDTEGSGADWDLVSAFSHDPADGLWHEGSYVNSNANTDAPNLFYYSASVDLGQEGTAVAVWTTWAALPGSTIDGACHVMTARSEDYGNTWSKPKRITPRWLLSSPKVNVAHVVFVGQNRWFAWWKANEVDFTGFYSISDNDGFTWSAPQVFYGEMVASDRQGNLLKVHNTFESPTRYGITRLQRTNTQFDEPAFVPVHPSGLVHSSGSNWLLIGPDKDVYASTDNGLNWVLQPADINAPGPNDLYITNDGSGKVAATYYTTLNATHVKYQFTTSIDNGAHWSSPSTPMSAWNPFAGDADPLLIESPEAGKWVGVRGYIGQLNCSYSADNGQNWNPFELVPGENRPYYSAKKYVTPSSLAAKDSRALLVWSTFDGMYVTTSRPGQPAAAADWQLYR